MDLQFIDDKGKILATIKLEEHTFKSGSKGYYFRDRVDIGKDNYHAQVIISKK